MTLAATVVVPTHVHGPTLHESIGTARNQTLRDIEIFIVGDGVDDVTRNVASELQRSDPRVRFFDFPKGPNYGEVHRHVVLAEATGRIVCYLSDDDLWFPDHIATMDGLLQGGTCFAHALPLRIEPDGRLGDRPVDLALEFYRRQAVAGRSFIPLSCGAHTLDAYRRLPVGWSTTPRLLPGTDRFMWQKLIEAGCRTVTSVRPTVLVFPSPDRKGWSVERRAEELASWRTRIEDPDGQLAMLETALDYFVRDRARLLSRTPRARLFDLLAAIRLLAMARRCRTVARALLARVTR